jgi:hypothetical protein
MKPLLRNKAVKLMKCVENRRSREGGDHVIGKTATSFSIAEVVCPEASRCRRPISLYCFSSAPFRGCYSSLCHLVCAEKLEGIILRYEGCRYPMIGYSSQSFGCAPVKSCPLLQNEASGAPRRRWIWNPPSLP